MVKKMKCEKCGKMSKVIILKDGSPGLCVDCRSDIDSNGTLDVTAMREKFRRWCSKKSLKDFLIMFLENKMVNIGTMDIWPSQIKVNGEFYEFQFTAGKELDEDRGWWSSGITLTEELAASESELNSIRRKLHDA
jgi:hypothetical protein